MPSHAAARAAAALSLGLSVTAPAAAQSVQTTLAVNAGLHTLAEAFTHEVVFDDTGGIYEDVLSRAAARERTRMATAYDYRNTSLLDATAAVTLPSRVGAGVSVTRWRTAERAVVEGSIPHPHFFDADRSIAGTSAPLQRRETAIHLEARAAVAATRTVTLTVFGGPSLFRLHHDLVTDASFTQAWPYDSAAFDAATMSHRRGTGLGFHGGADVVFYFTERAGIGWLWRYSRGTVELSGAGEDLAIATGGLQTALGLRLRF